MGQMSAQHDIKSPREISPGCQEIAFARVNREGVEGEECGNVVELLISSSG